MNGDLAKRTKVMFPNYEKLFANRGGITPDDPLRFHLYHLARYWSRLLGFCRQVPGSAEGFINTDLGACVAVGSEFTNKSIEPNSPIYDLWQVYWKRTNAVLHNRPVTLQDVEAASQAFNECLAGLKYDPWSHNG